MTLHVEGIDDLLRLQGQELGVSEWRPITQELMNQFGDATGNRQWIHVDAERARQESPIGSTIAAGIQLLAMAAAMQTMELIQLAGFTLVRDRGYDRVRYTYSVLPGSCIRLRVTLADVKIVSKSAVDIWLEQALEVKVDDRVQTACVATNIIRLDK